MNKLIQSNCFQAGVNKFYHLESFRERSQLIIKWLSLITALIQILLILKLTLTLIIIVTLSPAASQLWLYSIAGITDEEDATYTGGTLKKGSTANTAKDTASRLKSWIYKPRKEGGTTWQVTFQYSYLQSDYMYGCKILTCTQCAGILVSLKMTDRPLVNWMFNLMTHRTVVPRPHYLTLRFNIP